MKDDAISKAAAIDAVNNMIRRKFGISADLGTGALLELPSAQPDHIGEVTEMVGDTISRQMALKELENLNIASFYEENEHSREVYTEVKAMLNALPSAQQWIPTSERLPEGICQVIVQTNGGAIHDVFYEGKNAYGHEVWMMVDGGIYWDDEVVAWMPLPKPWKGERR